LKPEVQAEIKAEIALIVEANMQSFTTPDREEQVEKMITVQ